ncbi:unnamed protein product, partial [Urochloa humidicola]
GCPSLAPSPFFSSRSSSPTPPLSPCPSSPASAAALPAPLIPAGPSSPLRAEEQMPLGVEPPVRRRPVPASIFPTPPARHRLGSSVVPDRGPSSAASSSGGLELRSAGERAGPQQTAAAAARRDLDDATVVDRDAGGPPCACRCPHR